jgi:hypothetical protein
MIKKEENTFLRKSYPVDQRSLKPVSYYRKQYSRVGWPNFYTVIKHRII